MTNTSIHKNAHQKIYTYVALLLVGISLYLAITSLSGVNLFWDLSVYERAISDYRASINPYRQDEFFLFIYHPYVLEALNLIGFAFPLKPTLIATYAICSLYFVHQLLAFIINAHEQTHSKYSVIFWVILGGCIYGGAGTISFLTGNLTPYCHMLLISLFLAAYKKGKSLSLAAFVISICALSIIKPYLLSYLILLPYITQKKRAAIITILSVALTTLLWLSAKLFNPDLYKSFMLALKNQTLGRADLGYSIFGIFHELLGSPVAILLHISIMTLLAYIAFTLSRKADYEWFSKATIPITVAWLITINPRMKEYDFFIAIIFLYAIIFISSSAWLKTFTIVGFSIVVGAQLFNHIHPNYHPVGFGSVSIPSIVQVAVFYMLLTATLTRTKNPL